ncbi:Protein of unknown function [Bacillus wiedmannii]|nr:Protein of unknown function [Bacillus wiedmannii]
MKRKQSLEDIYSKHMQDSLYFAIFSP